MRAKLFFKRIFDIFCSVILLIVFSPVFVGLAIAVKADSKGPVIFKQDRLGKNGKVFKLYKFRSMVVGAEKQGAGLFNYEGDPRVTKVGRFLRSSSLDELPQLVNVLQGPLSLVGPRPPVVYELGDYDTLNEKFKKRFTVKPGITGLAQIKGRNDILWDEKVGYDNEYIDKFNKYGIFYDIKILFGTLFGAFAGKDIYEHRPEGAADDAEAAALAEREVIRMAHEPVEK